MEIKKFDKIEVPMLNMKKKETFVMECGSDCLKPETGINSIMGIALQDTKAGDIIPIDMKGTFIVGSGCVIR